MRLKRSGKSVRMEQDSSPRSPCGATTRAMANRSGVDVDASDDVDVDSSVRTEGGEKVKVMEFGGLDISGRLKSPQLLYFLNRLRAEFDRPRLPHRSFVGELERSTHEKSF